MQSLLPDILAAIIFVDSLKFPLHQIFTLLFKLLLKPILQASLSAFSPSIHPYEPISQVPMPTCPQSNQDIASIPPSLRDPCISLGHSSLSCLSGSVDCSTFSLFLSTDIYNIIFFIMFVSNNYFWFLCTWTTSILWSYRPVGQETYPLQYPEKVLES